MVQHFSDSGYPWFPNEAGVAWINLVKETWTSDEVIDLNSGSTLEKFTRNLYNGEYTFELVGDDNRALLYRTVITNENCKIYEHNKIEGKIEIYCQTKILLSFYFTKNQIIRRFRRWKAG